MKNGALVRGVAGTLLVFFLLLGVLYAGLMHVATHSAQAQASTLRESVVRALLTCYAVEGRYPPDVGYLQSYYGLTYDANRFIVTIDSFAENLLPDVTILTEGEG